MTRTRATITQNTKDIVENIARANAAVDMLRVNTLPYDPHGSADNLMWKLRREAIAAVEAYEMALREQLEVRG